MTDKIGPTTSRVDLEIGRLTRPEAERGRRVDTGDQRAAPVSDEATISMQAVQMQHAREAVDQAPDVRREVVDRIRQEISSGRYTVDSDQIARRLVDVLG